MEQNIFFHLLVVSPRAPYININGRRSLNTAHNEMWVVVCVFAQTMLHLLLFFEAEKSEGLFLSHAWKHCMAASRSVSEFLYCVLSFQNPHRSFLVFKNSIILNINVITPYPFRDSYSLSIRCRYSWILSFETLFFFHFRVRYHYFLTFFCWRVPLLQQLISKRQLHLYEFLLYFLGGKKQFFFRFLSLIKTSLGFVMLHFFLNIRRTWKYMKLRAGHQFFLWWKYYIVKLRTGHQFFL